MPRWLRLFIIKEVNEYHSKDKNDNDEGTILDSKGNIKIPSFLKGKSDYN